MDRPIEHLLSLVHELCRLTGETEWVEFKVNIRKPEEVGEYISALAYSAALIGKAFAYVVWGRAIETIWSSAQASTRTPQGSRITRELASSTSGTETRLSLLPSPH